MMGSWRGLKIRACRYSRRCRGIRGGCPTRRGILGRFGCWGGRRGGGGQKRLMLPAVMINCDLSCVACEYNLRGLMTDGKCPECGAAIHATLERVPPGEIPELEDVILSIRRRRYEPLARAAGASIDAVMIVHD